MLLGSSFKYEKSRFTPPLNSQRFDGQIRGWSSCRYRSVLEQIKFGTEKGDFPRFVINHIRDLPFISINSFGYDFIPYEMNTRELE